MNLIFYLKYKNHIHELQSSALFGILFNFNLFLNAPTSIIVLSTGNNFVSKAFSNTFAGPQSLFSCTNAHQV